MGDAGTQDAMLGMLVGEVNVGKGQQKNCQMLRYILFLRSKMGGTS
jgi:hypothetical protein